MAHLSVWPGLHDLEIALRQGARAVGDDQIRTCPLEFPGLIVLRVDSVSVRLDGVEAPHDGRKLRLADRLHLATRWDRDDLRRLFLANFASIWEERRGAERFLMSSNSEGLKKTEVGSTSASLV